MSCSASCLLERTQALILRNGVLVGHVGILGNVGILVYHGVWGREDVQGVS